MKDNTIHYDFKKYRNSRTRRKRLIRIMAVFGSFLMVSGLIFSIICYVLGK